MNWKKLALLGVLGAAVVTVCANLAGIEVDTGASEKSAAAKQIGLAEASCQLAIEKAAHDPSSITWIRSEREFAYASADRARSIQPLRAKNAMGALVRTVAVCDLRRVAGDWRVSSVALR